MPGWRCTLIGYADLQFQEETPTRKGFEELSGECGIAVMTNSAAGTTVCWKIMNAMAYIKGWSSVPYMYGNPTVTIPFAAREAPLDPSWETWEGSWSRWMED